MSTLPHPAVPADLTTGRFVSLRLARAAPGAQPGTATSLVDEVVLARLDDDPRPDSVVLAREAGVFTMRRVGRVTPESVELLPLDTPAPPRLVPRGHDAVVGTVLLRWQAD